MTATESAAASLDGLLGTVGEAMTGEVVALEADTPVDVAVRRLEHTQVSGAPVVDHGRVVGVVTLRDLLVPVLAEGPVMTTGPFHRQEHQLTTWRVHELMTAEPVTARPDWPLAQAVLAMEQAGINRLPVVDSAGRPAGILTRDDVLRVLARRIRGVGLQARPGSQVEPD
ncbi:MAG TPA: CBS domain-containing protein [Actinomycetota bacterium]